MDQRVHAAAAGRSRTARRPRPQVEPGPPAPAEALLRLQRTIGNRSVARLVRSGQGLPPAARGRMEAA